MSNNNYNIKVQVNSLLPIEKEVKKLFFDILNDYVERFNAKTVITDTKLAICLIEYNENSAEQGLACYPEDLEQLNRVLVQIRDPALNGWEGNPSVILFYVGTMCHEFVHVCQYLTGRKGFPIKGAKYNKKDPRDSYFFNPVEVEARAFEAIYTSLYGMKLVEKLLCSDPS